MTTETLEFPGSTGARLSGILEIPAESIHQPILMAHCFTCSKDQQTTARLAKRLVAAGHVVLRFDFTGRGESEGDFGDTTIVTRITDLTRAAATMIEAGYPPAGLVGHSLGGAAMLLAAGHIKTARSIAVIGAPSDPRHVEHLVEGAERGEDGRLYATIAGRSFAVSDEFVTTLDSHDQTWHVDGLNRPLMVVHAVNDEVVGVEEGEKIFAAARQPKAFVPILDADHLLTNRDKAEEVADTLIEWFARTIGETQPPGAVE